MVGFELGQRFHALKSGQRSGRVNIIAALCNQNLLAPFTIEGACNRMVFETWLENCLLPTLRAGQFLVMDNATFHKGGCIEQLIQDAGCELLYLPPYSPDLNKSFLVQSRRRSASGEDETRIGLKTITGRKITAPGVKPIGVSRTA